jgi:hypothetical protein
MLDTQENLQSPPITITLLLTRLFNRTCWLWFTGRNAGVGSHTTIHFLVPIGRSSLLPHSSHAP